MITGARIDATIPAAKPLLYRFSPPCTEPTLRAAEEWMKPATTPQCHPKRPAIGARLVPNKAASRIDGSAAPQGFASDPRNTPAMIGTKLTGCLPNAAKPTIDSRAPITGPFSSPPTART